MNKKKTTEQIKKSEGNPDFHRLWPTLFMSIKLPGFTEANPIISGLVLRKNVEKDQMTTDYLSENFITNDHPAIIWLKQCIDRAIIDFKNETNISHDLEWFVHAWPNVNFRVDYHNLHNHPHSWLSGTYYLNVPDQSEAEMFRSDLNPGAISFFDPRPQANMNSISNDGQHDPEYRLIPEEGDLYLWPSFLHHLVHPNLVDQPRLSISFNVTLKNITKYMG